MDIQQRRALMLVRNFDQADLDRLYASRVAELDRRATKLIRETCAEHDERNAAIGGILTAEREQEIRDAIISARTAYKARVAELDAALATEGTLPEKAVALKAVPLTLTTD